ncbi:MAG: hypothetical protein H7176_05675 [Bdellovibrionales bacterium]|nr:hypothetical protein [Massilia sp.]
MPVENAVAHEALAEQLYVTFYGRPATQAELSTLSLKLKAAAAPTSLAELEAIYPAHAATREVLDAFTLSSEWNQQYFNTGYVGYDFTFVKAVYNNLFNRDPEIATWETIARSINAGSLTRVKAALAIASGAKGAEADLAARKFTVARSFTRASAAVTPANSYAGPVAFSMARSLLQDVASAADERSIQAQQDAAIGAVVNLARGSYSEERGAPRKIVLLASADQASVQAERLASLATALGSDLNSRLGVNGPTWSVSVATTAPTAHEVRSQLSDVAGAGAVPVPKEQGMPALDAYRLPKCKAIQFKDSATDIISRKTIIEADPDCRNGATISVLRGTSSATETAELSRKLDQMIAYHRNSTAANAGWERRAMLVQAFWVGGYQWADVSALWDRIGMYDKDKNATVNSGSGSERRAAFLGCVASKTEMCVANVHGAPLGVVFEGPGTSGVFYSSDSVWLTAAELAAASIRAKYVEMVSCSTQNFLIPRSVGTTLLMGGDGLLINGFVTDTLVSSEYTAYQVANQYSLLNAGASFADAWLGQAEHGPIAFQGDPYITMRPAADPVRRPLLVVDGKHYTAGSAVVTVDLPDSLAARTIMKLLVLSNRGTADLHVRVDSTVAKNGVADATGGAIESEQGDGAQYTWGRMLAGPDAYLYDPVVEQSGGRLPLTIRPGASVAVHYRLDVRIDASGKPKRPGIYTGEVQLLSDDPASARLHMALRTRVH